MAKRIDAKNLNIYYGKFLAVSEVNFTIEPALGDRVHRPVRLRQVDRAAHAEPHARGDRRRARRRRRAARRRQHLRQPTSTR